MKRRGFLVLLAGAAAASMEPLRKSCLPAQDAIHKWTSINDYLIQEAHRITADIYRCELTTSPWNNCVDADRFPEQMGETVTSISWNTHQKRERHALRSTRRSCKGSSRLNVPDA